MTHLKYLYLGRFRSFKWIAFLRSGVSHPRQSFKAVDQAKKTDNLALSIRRTGQHPHSIPLQTALSSNVRFIAHTNRFHVTIEVQFSPPTQTSTSAGGSLRKERKLGHPVFILRHSSSNTFFVEAFFGGQRKCFREYIYRTHEWPSQASITMTRAVCEIQLPPVLKIGEIFARYARNSEHKIANFDFRASRGRGRRNKWAIVIKC